MGKNEPTDSRYPLLEKIDSPTDLRRLDIAQLPEVCAEIRSFLIDSLSHNPGHFASSMGAVELTVALHYVFNTPYDRIVWDVGHQAYGHKLLTGRRDSFQTLRKLGGLAGFPNPEESEYDTFTAGHASNSISAALGMSVATHLSGESPERNVVAVIGDASISGGLAFEALNNAANANANLLIILNDNDMSIDRPTGSLNSYLAHMTTSKAYNTLRYKVYRMLKKMRLVSERRRGSILRFTNSLKSLIVHEQNLFEGLNLRYFGPFDGHDIQRIVRVLSDIKDMKGPRLLHLRTVKGKGFAPAEADPANWHAPGLFNPSTGVKIKKTSTTPVAPKFQDVFGETLVELACGDNRIVGITAAMPSGTSMSKLNAAFPDRTFDVGISEGHAVTFAGGMAKEGLRPFVAIYSSFLQRAYDNIIHDVAIQGLPVTFCIDRAGIVGEDGVTHHGSFDPAYLRVIPGMTVAAARDEHQLRNLLYTASLREKGPWSIRYPRGAGKNPDWRNEMTAMTPGRGEKLRDGSDIAILTIGPMAAAALQAAEAAKVRGISVAVYDMIWIKPLDNSIVDTVAAGDSPIITVEDGSVIGGLGSAVADRLAETGRASTLLKIGMPDNFVAHGTVCELHRQCGMDADSILAAIVKLTNKAK